MHAWFTLLTFSFVVTACDAETCREKRATFACDQNFTIVCDSLESTDDPVCRCDGDFALADNGACRTRDIAGCCTCLVESDAGSVCTAGSERACSDALASGALISVDEECRQSRCGDVCWFLRPVDGGA